MTRKPKMAFRKVPALDPMIWEDAYFYLADYHEDFLDGVEDAVAKGYTPDEIYRHVLREAGVHRIEIAKRCQNAARHIIAQNDT